MDNSGSHFHTARGSARHVRGVNAVIVRSQRVRMSAQMRADAHSHCERPFIAKAVDSKLKTVSARVYES